MYFQIATSPEDKHFSYLLGKNPASPPYSREIGSSTEGKRTVLGQYTGTNVYTVTILNDEVHVMETLRAQNKPSYVSAKPYAVIPYNLRGVGIALKSAISGHNPDPEHITPEELARPRELMAALGPFVVPRERLIETFDAAGFRTEVIGDGQNAFMVALFSKDHSLKRFLQMVYVLSMHLTVRQHDDKYLQDSQIRSLITDAKEWLATMGAGWAERIIHRLTGGHKGLKAEFVEALEEPETPEGEEQEGPSVKEVIREATLEAKMGLHAKRHQIILDQIPADAKRIVELGCGSGKLLTQICERFPDTQVVGIEADIWDAKRATRKARKAKVVISNLVFPYLEGGMLRPDVLILSEVIEHLIERDRKLVIEQIVRMWRPKMVLITTPNRAYNATWGLEGFRHPDHKVEYYAEDWRREVVDPLGEAYSIEEFPLIETESPEDPQPSFILKGTHMAVDAKPDWRYVYRGRDAHAPYYIEETGYTVSPNEMKSGLLHPAFRNNRANVPYLSPTMAPVEWSSEVPEFLEHPQSAFAYYKARHVNVLIEQEKAMGSRCHLLVFKSSDAANRAGYKDVIYGVSRSGYSIFESDEDAMRVWAEIAPRMPNDVMLFDAELLPWSYKASSGTSGLIANAFQGPGEAALLFKRAAGQDAEHVERYLDVLSWFAEKGPMRVVLFDILATANVNPWKRYVDLVLGHTVSVETRMHTLEPFRGEIVRPVAWNRVDLMVGSSMRASEIRWNQYTNAVGRGEGFVYKPFENYVQPNGAPLQPALKVRGREYLRLIYGFNYTRPEIFNRLVKRKIAAKRRLALQEHVLGLRILSAFFKNLPAAHERAVAAFLGMDGTTGVELDATL